MVERAHLTDSMSVVVRPRSELLRNMLLSSIVAGVPLFGVLYWLALTQGNWGRVFVVQLVFLLFVLMGVVRYYTAYVRVTPETIRKQGFVRLTVVDRADVASVLIVDTYRDGSHETLPQLLARNTEGVAVFRMRGIYWSRDSMDAVSAALGVPTILEEHPFTLEEFYDLAPGTAHWYERQRWIPVAVIAVAFLASLVVTSWLMTAVGLPGIFTFGR